MISLLELYEKWGDEVGQAKLDEIRLKSARADTTFDTAYGLAFKLAQKDLLSFSRKQCEPYIKWRMTKTELGFGEQNYDKLEKYYKSTKGSTMGLVRYDWLRFIDNWPLARVENGRKEWLESLKVKE